MNTPTDLKHWLLKQPRRVAIVPHARPDGDALGSTLGLLNTLAPMGHSCTVVSPTTPPGYFSWLPGFDQVIDATADPRHAATVLADAELRVALDFGVPTRADSLETALLAPGAWLLNIDHHDDAVAFAHVSYTDPSASSSSELVHRLLTELGFGPNINTPAATCLYTGLLTDTGSFRHGPTTARVLQTAASLVESGANPAQINHLVYSTLRPGRLQCFGHVLAHHLHHYPQLRTAVLVVPAHLLQQFQMGPGETDGLVNYGTSLLGVNLSVLLVEYPTEVKLSFRSVGRFPANQLAKHFAGGGHYNAAGGRSTTSLDETRAQLMGLLQGTYAPLLDYEAYA